MIQSIKIKNFKNLTEQFFEFSPQITLIHGDNGKWKSSLLEALSYLGNINSKSKAENLVKSTESSFFLQLQNNENELKGTYDTTAKKKSFAINNKKISSKKFFTESSKFCYFDPEIMNLFLLGPSHRRDYINTTISNCFPGYASILKHYNKILKSRNAVLWAVAEWKAQESEIDYWDDSFCEAATEVYRYRYLFIEFFSSHSELLKKCTWEKYRDTSFQYSSKVDFKNPKETLQKYLKENRKRDIIIQKTHIWPHRDDFSILVNNSLAQEYASRWEIKSIILGLKFIESQFIEKHTKKKAIFLIDDFSSELDTEHQNTLLSLLSEHQVILTNIEKIDIQNSEVTYIHLL